MVSKFVLQRRRVRIYGGDFINKRTMALTVEQYKEIISTMKQGFCGCRPNPRAATALMLEANLGLRISDILQLRLCDIVKDGEVSLREYGIPQKVAFAG